MKYLFELIIENPILFILVIAIIGFQYFFFFKRTRARINDLKAFFPIIENLKVIYTAMVHDDVADKESLDNFVDDPTLVDDVTDGDDYDIVTLISVPSSEKGHEMFDKVVHKTNIYLCKNSGSSADFSLLKDICERQIEICEGEIQNSLNAPLYLGLAGTFLGIITGLWGVNLSAVIGGSAQDLAPFQHLLGGVVVAMLASLAGLTFTIINSQLNYKDAARKVDSDKDDYFDLLQRELMPTLSTSMAASLNALRSVLGHFVDSFGKNLDSYTDSISLLNDNVKQQHDVLIEINKLNMSETAVKIAETFSSLKDSAAALDIFKGYQDQLNKTMSKTSSGLESAIESAGKTVKDTLASAGDKLSSTFEVAGNKLADTVNQVDLSVGRLENVIGAFEDFGLALKVVVQNQAKTVELQSQFQKSIETHFPAGSVGRQVWQNEFDLLQKESLEASRHLENELKESTKYIQDFVSSNKSFFGSFDDLQKSMAEIASYAKAQIACYNDLKTEIEALREDSKDKQLETISLHQALLDAVKTMTLILDDKHK